MGDDRRLGPVWLRSDAATVDRLGFLGTPLGDRYDAPIDLRKEIGLRIWVRQGTDRAMILLHFHHACADALGSFSFVEDFLALYSTLYPGGPAVRLRPLEPQRLLGRGLSSIPQRKWYHRPLDFVFGMAEAVLFLLQPPAPLASPALPTADERKVSAGMLTRSLGHELTAKMRGAATQVGATVNDLLLCNLFVTLKHWNAAHGQTTKWLRILMPQNLRTAEDGSTPTANIMSFAFLTRRFTACDSATELMPSLHAQTGAIRRNRLSVFFLKTVTFALSIGVSKKCLASKNCFATATLSNLGLPTRRFVAQFPHNQRGLIVGNLVFHSLTGVPPIRPGTRAAFAIITSVDDTLLAMKYDAQYLRQADARQLLEEYVQQIMAASDGGLAGEDRRGSSTSGHD